MLNGEDDPPADSDFLANLSTWAAAEQVPVGLVCSTTRAALQAAHAVATAQEGMESKSFTSTNREAIASHDPGLPLVELGPSSIGSEDTAPRSPNARAGEPVPAPTSPASALSSLRSSSLRRAERHAK